jgi:cell division protein FtsB
MKPSKGRRVTDFLPRRPKLLFLIGLLFLGLLFLFFAPGRGLLQYRALKKEVNRLQLENVRLEEENREIKTEIERLEQDPAYLEEVARHKHGMLKKDEMVFKFKDKK